MTVPAPASTRLLFGIPLPALLVALGIVLTVCGMNVITPLIPAIQEEQGIDYVTAGILVSAFGLARLAATLPVGFLEARIGRRRLAILGTAILVVGSVAAAVAPTFQGIIVSRVVMGFGSCVLIVISLTALADLARDGARARVMMLFTFSNNLGIAAYPMIGGFMGQAFGWRSTMLLSGALAILAGLIFLKVLPEASERTPRKSSGAASTGPEEAVSPMRMAAIIAIYFGVVIYVTNRLGFRNAVMPLLANDSMGLTPLQIATGITVSSVLALTVSVGGAIVADRWSRRGVIVVGFLAFGLGELAFLGASSYTTFLLACFLLGLSDFFSASQTAALTETVPPSWRGRSLGIYRFFVDLGATLGPTVLATILQLSGPTWTILTMVMLMAIAAAGALLGALADRQVRLQRAGLKQADAVSR
ncbi:MAG: MFS transporter [Chloroflexi bacterium]|nr:MFS transporter [Chloroflexota bacterium]